MDLSEWNNLIAEQVFNEKNAGKFTYLYFSKEDIINIGKKKLPALSNVSILNLFFESIRSHLKNNVSGNPIIELALEKHREWRTELESNSLNTFNYPTFIIFLVLTVLPLTETHSEFDYRNYYDPLKQFLKDNKLPCQNIDTLNFMKLDLLWKELREWLNIIRSGELGLLQLQNFGNKNWVHVGYPMSQCLLTPYAFQKLPELFFKSELAPYTFYDDEYFRQIILYHNSNILKLRDNITKLIINKNNEAGNIIIDIVRKEFNKWNGEIQFVEKSDESEKKIRENTTGTILMQLKLDLNEEKIEVSHRMLSKSEYGILNFGEFIVEHEAKGYSCSIFCKDIPALSNDKENKWIARLPQKNIRLFINAGYFKLSTNYCIETDSLVRANQMYLLCNDLILNDIVKWGTHFAIGDFEHLDFEGLPEGQSLFRFKNPTQSHSKFHILSLDSHKYIELIDGVKIKHRSFLNIYTPLVEIKNAQGNERVFMEYLNDGAKQLLSKDDNFYDRYHFPDDLKENLPFKIKIENEILVNDNFVYEFVKNNYLETIDTDIEIPMRDKFGKITTSIENAIIKGNEIMKQNFFEKQQIYLHLFRGNSNSNITFSQKNNGRIEYSNKTDSLLNYLSAKKTCTTEEFYKIFEIIFEYQLRKNSLTLQPIFKRASLNLYSYLGFIDYDYESKKIALCPPQLILIPENNGRRALVLGARDEILINNLYELCNQYHIGFKLEEQSKFNSKYLLPRIITLYSFSGDSEKDELKISEISKKCRIPFKLNIVNQIGYQLLSASITEYESYIVNNCETGDEDYSWVRYIFDKETLKFTLNNSTDFDRELCLIEYKFNEYEYKHKLWLKNKCYTVDKNWGRHLILNKLKINFINYDEKNKILEVPVSTPLPLILSKSLVLLSGKVPELKEISKNGIKMYYQTYFNIPAIIAKNFQQFVLGQSI